MNEQKSTGRYAKFVGNTGLVAFTNVLRSLGGIILLPLLTKNLSISDYGIWVQIGVTASLLAPLATMGLPFTLVRFLPGIKDKEEVQELVLSVTTFVFLVASVVAGLLIIGSKPLAAAFFGGETGIFILLAGIVLLQCLNSVFFNVFRAYQEMRWFSFFHILETYGQLALIAYLLFSGYGLWYAVLAMLIAKAVVFLLMSGLVMSRIGLRLPRFSRIKENLRFGLPLLPSGLANWVVQLSDRYVISILLGLTFVGFYSPAYMLGNVIFMLFTPLGIILPAVVAKLYNESNEVEVKIYLRYSLKYFLMLAIPATFGLSILSAPLLVILTTEEIASQAHLVTPFIALSALLFGVYGVKAQSLMLLKKTRVMGITWSIAAMLNLGMNLVAVPRFGILGAASATLIAHVFVLAIISYHSTKYLSFRIDWKFIGKSILASGIMSLFLWFIHPSTILHSLLVIAVGATIYFGILFLSRGFTRQEIDFWRSRSRLGATS